MATIVDIKNILTQYPNDLDTAFSEIIKTQTLFGNLLIKLNAYYDVAKLSKPISLYKTLELRTIDLYHTLTNLVWDVDDLNPDVDTFNLQLDLLTMYFNKYKDDGISYDAINRISLKYKFPDRDLKLFNSLLYILDKLSDTTTRKQNLQNIDFDSLLCRDTTRIGSTEQRLLIEYFTK